MKFIEEDSTFTTCWKWALLILVCVGWILLIPLWIFKSIFDNNEPETNWWNEVH